MASWSSSASGRIRSWLAIRLLTPQKHPDGNVAGDVLERVAQCVERLRQLVPYLIVRLDAGQDAPVIRSVIAVMEQGQVPVGLQALQEAQQGTRPFGKVEAEQEFVLYRAGPAAYQVARVGLDRFVVAQVGDNEAF